MKVEETSSENNSDTDLKHRQKEKKLSNLEYEEENLRERLLKRVKLRTNR